MHRAEPHDICRTRLCLRDVAMRWRRHPRIRGFERVDVIGIGAERHLRCLPRVIREPQIKKIPRAHALSREEGARSCNRNGTPAAREDAPHAKAQKMLPAVAGFTRKMSGLDSVTMEKFLQFRWRRWREKERFLLLHVRVDGHRDQRPAGGE